MPLSIAAPAGVVSVLSGIATPVNGLSLTGVGELTIVIAARFGTLTADSGPGASVHGSGSSLVWFTGTVREVNNTLATLVYTGRVDDALTVTTLESLNGSTQTVFVPIAASPLVRTDDGVATIQIDAGTLMLDSRIVDGPSIALHEASGGTAAASLVLVNSTLSRNTSLSSVNDNNATGVAPRVAVAGRVEVDGMAAFAGGPTLLTIAQGAVLANEGTMRFTGASAHLTGAGVLQNDGTIGIDATTKAALIAVALTGSGQVSLGDGASLALAGTVGAEQTIAFGDGVNTVRLTQPTGFAGVIAAFAPGDRIDVSGVTASASFFTRINTTDGMLALFDGGRPVLTLRFAELATDATFSLSQDDTGLAIGMTPALPQPATFPASLDVFRFFDRATGTHFLTQDAAERDSVLADRPDLAYEGIGFRALGPALASGDAVTVFRFFDQRSGTHLFTASATERDTILASRPDLLFEPGSTLLEHASPHPDDVAVYRFFDRVDGTHFFTADPGERATVLTTRPDLTDEGVAFYAPRG